MTMSSAPGQTADGMIRVVNPEPVVLVPVRMTPLLGEASI
jgi:hypothetical protein